MAEKSIYRSPAGRAEVMALYDRVLASLDVPVESLTAPTRFGATHVLAAGPADGPPLLNLPGVHAGAPRTLAWYRSLTQHHRVYVPDTVGQPGRSAETRPASRGRQYGRWVEDVMDGLGLEQAAMLGTSFGAAILLDLAAWAPQRISKAVLVVPAGFVTPSLAKLCFRLFLPWLHYRLRPSRGRLLASARPLATELDEAFLLFFDTTIRHVKWLVAPPGHFAAQDLARFQAPTLVMAARDDFYFPLPRLLSRAKEIIPNLAGVEVFEGKHIGGKAVMEQMNGRILRFLSGEG